MKQYPHFLFVHVVADSVQDQQTGNWTESVNSWVKHSICREETNGKGQTVNGPDGKAIVFSSTVYMPKSAATIKEGTEALVSETESINGAIRIKGQVLKFSPGQLNCRLWI